MVVCFIRKEGIVQMGKLTRRNFLKVAGATSAAGLLAACGNGGSEEPAADEGEGEEGEEEPAAEGGDTPMVVGYSPFSSKFSPYFAETAYDQDAQGMTQVALIPTDRLGQIIFNGIDGETVEFNGTDYTYYGPANVTVTENADGTVDYDIQLREDIVFSDGASPTASP